MSRLVTDHLPLLAGAPNGVKKLRELILELATSGRLLEPDEDWRQTQLRELVTSSGAGWSPSCETWPRTGDEWGVLKVSAVSWSQFRPEENKALPAHLEPRPELEVCPGDFLISRANTAELVARSVVVEDTPSRLILSDKIVRLRLSGACDPRFIQLVNSAPKSRSYYARAAGGTSSSMKNVSREQILALPVLLPSLAEQHRIVTKVNELMALCDRLETRQSDAQAAHARLVDELLGSLLQARDAEDFGECWGRVKGSFDVLFTTEQSVDALKQSILRLAVMGKLVEQDPTEEPANSLMSRLRKDRANWLQANSATDAECRTMLRKLDPIKSGSLPFSLPKSWQAVSLIDCCRLLVDCHNKTAPYTGSGIPIIRTSNIRNREFRYEDLRFVSEETYEFWSRRCPPAPGDIMFTREAPMGEAAIIPVEKKFCLGQRIMLIRPMSEYINTKYLLLALTEPNLLERASTDAIGSTVKHLRVGDVEDLCLPLPPLAEQNRIVAKVDELINLCDQVKAKLARAQALNERLAGTLVERAVP